MPAGRHTCMSASQRVVTDISTQHGVMELRLSE